MRVMLGIVLLSYVTWLLIYKNNYTVEEKRYFNNRLLFVTILHVIAVGVVVLTTYIPYVKLVPIFIDFIVFGVIDHIFGKQALFGTPWKLWLLFTLLLLIIAGVTTITREYIKYTRKRRDYQAYKAKEQAEREAKAVSAMKHEVSSKNDIEPELNVPSNVIEPDSKKIIAIEQEPEGFIDTNMADDEVASSSAKLGQYAYVTNGVWMLSDDDHIDFINQKYHTEHQKLGDVSLYNFKTGERAW